MEWTRRGCELWIYLQHQTHVPEFAKISEIRHDQTQSFDTVATPDFEFRIQECDAT